MVGCHVTLELVVWHHQKEEPYHPVVTRKSSKSELLSLPGFTSVLLNWNLNSISIDSCAH